jgi:hypothetical protein
MYSFLKIEFPFCIAYATPNFLHRLHTSEEVHGASVVQSLDYLLSRPVLRRRQAPLWVSRTRFGIARRSSTPTSKGLRRLLGPRPTLKLSAAGGWMFNETGLDHLTETSSLRILAPSAGKVEKAT